MGVGVEGGLKKKEGPLIRREFTTDYTDYTDQTVDGRPVSWFVVPGMRDKGIVSV